jgi:two-component system, LytTR family, sensor kinase
VNAAAPSPLQRWLIYAALWLLLSVVFASQVFLAGYITPWSRAFMGELVYWLAWGAMLPFVFWWCRHLRERSFAIRVTGLVFGAFVTALLGPLFSQAIISGLVSTGLCGADCPLGVRPFSGPWLTQAVRVAGVNLPVYAGFVLAWHAATFYRESRDRQVRAKELESLLHQSQLEALRSQLNPHFLFNALHSIAELVHANPKLAEQLSVRLGELLRQVLQSPTRADVPLSDELEFIRAYVEIEQLRLGERLKVTWNVDGSVLPARVPSLVLQPLVENAIQHGIAASAAGGSLTISARRDGEFLHLQVSDSGPGIAAAPERKNSGIGLANTRQRLERLFGERHSLELHSNHGLTVNLRIPLAIP